MKYCRYTFIVLMIMLLASCASRKVIKTDKPPQPEKTPPVVTVIPEDELFSSAEKYYLDKAYPEALNAFQKYLSSFPNGSWTAETLLRIGDIYTATGKPSQALPYYQRLTARYPKSASAQQAELGVLTALSAIGDYQKVVELGQVYVKKYRSSDSAAQALEMLADAYARMDLPTEAANAYSRVLEKTSEPDSARIIQKLKVVVSRMPISEVYTLLNRLESSRVKAEILLQAGQKYLESDKPEDAYNILTALAEQFPKQDAAVQALRMLQDLKTHSAYQHHAIGCLLPLTGTYEAYGKKALKGIELAQNQFALLNPDPPLTILIKDTESDPQKTTAAVKELAESGVAAIIGPVATADIAAAEAQKYDIPIITLTQKDQITRIGPSVFRNFMTPGAQTDAIVAFTAKKLGLSRFAILYPDEPYGINFMNLFKEQVESAGCRVVAIQAYDPIQTDFRETLQKLSSRYSPVPDSAKSSGAGKRMEPAPDAMPSSSEEFEALFIPDSPQKLAVIVPQLAYGNLRPSYLLGTNLWHSPKLIHTGGPSVQGSILPDGFFAESTSETVQQFVRIFQNAYKESPGYIEAVSYDTAMMMFQIISNPNTLFRASIIKELLRPDGYSGVTGNFRFNTDREVQKKLFLLQIKGEEFVEITIP
ncbi:MAG: penicillin-binding protein activator [Deltaproteobacteria bacterium]|nr:penicillin-binding protein activator [Deltaproteobacteria bacterium]